jgi:hypothetical protein
VRFSIITAFSHHGSSRHPKFLWRIPTQSTELKFSTAGVLQQMCNNDGGLYVLSCSSLVLRSNDWGNRIFTKVQVDEREYPRVHQAGFNLNQKCVLECSSKTLSIFCLTASENCRKKQKTEKKGTRELTKQKNPIHYGRDHPVHPGTARCAQTNF